MNEEGEFLQESRPLLRVILGDAESVCLSGCGLRSELVEYFRAQMRKDPDMASAVAAIRTLLEFLKRDKGGFFRRSLEKYI